MKICDRYDLIADPDDADIVSAVRFVDSPNSVPRIRIYVTDARKHKRFGALSSRLEYFVEWTVWNEVSINSGCSNATHYRTHGKVGGSQVGLPASLAPARPPSARVIQLRAALAR